MAGLSLYRQVNVPPVTVYPARRNSSAESISTCAAASNGMGFRCSYSSGGRRTPWRLTTDAALTPLLRSAARSSVGRDRASPHLVLSPGPVPSAL